MRIPGAPFETGTMIGAQAVSRPLKGVRKNARLSTGYRGGGSGWGVALRSPILRLAKEPRKSMARPPSLALPHKGGGNWRLASGSRALPLEIV